MAKLRLSVLGAFAEFERSLMRERQMEGIALAKPARRLQRTEKTLMPERAAELAQRACDGVPKAVPSPRLRDQSGDRLPLPALRQAGVDLSPTGAVAVPLSVRP